MFVYAVLPVDFDVCSFGLVKDLKEKVSGFVDNAGSVD